MNLGELLQHQGQSVWVDFLSRKFVTEDELRKLIERDGVTGVTSNPAIFQSAIQSSDSYDEQIASELKSGDCSVGILFERIAVKDVKAAADLLLPVYRATQAKDGFVSLEVSPHLSADANGTISEARQLWTAVGRPNLMIKVPGTRAGLEAVRQLIGGGINVNVTLLFSVTAYEAIAEAYIQGVEQFAAAGGDVSKVASVASFFVSRIDTALEEMAKQDPKVRNPLEAVAGKVAIANAKRAYQSYLRIFSSDRWKALTRRGANPQRLLWASTGTKNKAYSEVLYIEELIGPDTVTTVPLPTLDAFRRSGKVRSSLREDVTSSEQVLQTVAEAGVSLEAVSGSLLDNGLQLFTDAMDGLLGSIAAKRGTFLFDRINEQVIAIADTSFEDGIRNGQSSKIVRRIWQRDKSLWTNRDEDRWLGWLDAVDHQISQQKSLIQFSEEIRTQDFSDVLLLGMGGSCLGAEVWASTIPSSGAFPRLTVLDSTDPARIASIEAKLNLARTLFVVSSKSGSTIEPNLLKDYFFDKLVAAVGHRQATQQFVAITDPGSSLEKLANREHFRRIFHGDPETGGRYSALSPFGLVPAVLCGLDFKEALASSELMVRSCGADVVFKENPGALLGLAIAAAATSGRDKITIITSPSLANFGAWAEQLLAESTGKDGKGLIPIVGEVLRDASSYDNDRAFIYVELQEETDPAIHEALAALTAKGHPVVTIRVRSRSAIGQEFFRFEFATAVAGALLGVNPFDQPDVEDSKVRSRELSEFCEAHGKLPKEEPVLAGEDADIYAEKGYAETLRSRGAKLDTESWLKAHLGQLNSREYLGLLAYLSEDSAEADLLRKLRSTLGDKYRVATSLGFGPRYLHSTGQLFKGGKNSGLFLQITSDKSEDLCIPGRRATFGLIESAQARGDIQALSGKGRRSLRIHVKAPVSRGLERLIRKVTTF